MGNEPIVGGVATLAAHAMMVGHGSIWHGGDRDISVMRQEVNADTGGAEALEWNLPNAMRLYFDFPEYANKVSQPGRVQPRARPGGRRARRELADALHRAAP